MAEQFGLEQIPLPQERERTFCKDYGIDIQEWFDLDFNQYQYEKVCTDKDSPKEAARKERYPMMIQKESMLILGLLHMEDIMPETRRYYFEKQWQAIAMKYRRLDGSFVTIYLFSLTYICLKT